MATAKKSVPHYDAIKVQAAQLSLPKAFRRDLTFHDRRALASRDSNRPFLWAIRECGTHLVFPRDIAGQPGWRGDDVRSLVHSIATTEAGTRLYWWDGVALREVDESSALELMMAVERAALSVGSEVA